ncbi:MAG: L-serine ammonia-lyase, iron-sulfur-dependent, subunit alpha [Pseudomonadota bacterium]
MNPIVNPSAKDIFRSEVRPALGCTEPAAVALAAAAAASALPPGPLEKITVRLDPNVFKNCLAAAVPGGGGGKGPALAAALGALGGDPRLGLQALASVDERCLAEARRLVRSGLAGVTPDYEKQGIFISVRLSAGGRESEAVIRDRHDRLTMLRLDGREISSPLAGAVEAGGMASPAAVAPEALQRLSLETLVAMTDNLDQDDLDFLEEGTRMNRRLAEYGLRAASGLGVGRSLRNIAARDTRRQDLVATARMVAAAAADARMAGVSLPAMSSAGSGNHGLTAVLPILTLFDILGGDNRKMLRAVGLSHLATASVKAHAGRLSAVCGCSIAAGSGAAAGCAYFLGGDLAVIQGAVINVMADLAGVVCDGAKASCALKVATAAGTAVQSALLALEGVVAPPTDGLAGSVFEETAANLGLLSRVGMAAVDRTIIDIMAGKDIRTPGDRP